MKLSWGHKIIIVYGLFVAGIMTMVFLTSKQNRDLVTDDYYAEELAYQDVINKSAQTAALSAPIEVVKSGETISVDLPIEFDKKISKGKWTLYYAADRKKDVNGEFEISNRSLQIEIPENASGLYLFKIDWECDGISYYYEKKIFL
jgi:hypothetical protein